MSHDSNNRYRLAVEAVIFLVLMCVGLIWVAAGPLLPTMMQYFNAGRGLISWSVSIVPIVMSIVAIPAGLLTTRIGAKKVFAVGAFLQSAGLLTPFCTSFGLLIATRILFATGVAMTFPVAGGIVAHWFSRKELPFVNSLNISATSIGNAIGFLATAPLAAVTSWQTCLAIYGGLSLIFALAWMVTGREKMETIKDTVHENVATVSIASALKQRSTLILAGSLIGPFCLFMALSSWLPAYYNDVFNIPLTRASGVTAILTLTGIPACILGGVLPVRLGVRKPFLLVPGILMGLSGLGCFAINNMAVILTSVALFGFCNVLFMPTVFTIPTELPGITPRLVPLILAVTVAVGNIGGFLGPLIVGYLADILIFPGWSSAASFP